MRSHSGASPYSSALPPRWRVQRYESVGSTSDEARREALAGDPGRLWIIAREQTQGRGRHSRPWVSPSGNLYASALLIDPSPIALAPQIGFAAGIALCHAVADLGAEEVRLKWPNDLVYHGAKLAGLLVEGVALGPDRFCCIVGFGINCVSAPQGLAYRTTDLGSVLRREVAPETVFAALAPRFDEALQLWSAGANFARVRARWLERAAGLGEPIRIAGVSGTREGSFETIDASGRLVLRTGHGLESVESGDLTFLSAREGVANHPSESKTSQ